MAGYAFVQGLCMAYWALPLIPVALQHRNRLTDRLSLFIALDAASLCGAGRLGNEVPRTASVDNEALVARGTLSFAVTALSQGSLPWNKEPQPLRMCKQRALKSIQIPARQYQAEPKLLSISYLYLQRCVPPYAPKPDLDASDTLPQASSVSSFQETCLACSSLLMPVAYNC